MECLVQVMDDFSPAETQLETMYMHINRKKKKIRNFVEDSQYHRHPIHHQDTATSQSSGQISYKEGAH